MSSIGSSLERDKTLLSGVQPFLQHSITESRSYKKSVCNMEKKVISNEISKKPKVLEILLLSDNEVFHRLKLLSISKKKS